MTTKRLKVLITDADHEFLKIADQKLSERGFKVITTSSIMESIEFLKTITVDYILVLNQDDKKFISDFVQTLNKKPLVVDERFDGLLEQKETSLPTGYF